MRPAAPPVLVYDGECGFCRAWIERLQRWDRRRAIRLLRLQDPEAIALTGRSRDVLETAMHLVTGEGRVSAGAAAARDVLRYLPWGWVVRPIFSVPGAMAVAERVYAWVALRRQRLGGCGGRHCRLSVARDRKRD